MSTFIYPMDARATSAYFDKGDLVNCLRKLFVLMCLFTSCIAAATDSECANERSLARLGDRQIISAALSTGVGKCKMELVSNGTTTWIKVSGVFEFRGPVGEIVVQEEFPTKNSEDYDWAMQKLMIRFREKLIYCQCAP